MKGGLFYDNCGGVNERPVLPVFSLVVVVEILNPSSRLHVLGKELITVRDEAPGRRLGAGGGAVAQGPSSSTHDWSIGVHSMLRRLVHRRPFDAPSIGPLVSIRCSVDWSVGVHSFDVSALSCTRASLDLKRRRLNEREKKTRVRVPFLSPHIGGCDMLEDSVFE